MPIENNFQHDELSRKSPGERLLTAELAAGAAPESAAWFDAMAQCGSRLSKAGVRYTVLDDAHFKAFAAKGNYTDSPFGRQPSAPSERWMAHTH